MGWRGTENQDPALIGQGVDLPYVEPDGTRMNQLYTTKISLKLNIFARPTKLKSNPNLA